MFSIWVRFVEFINAIIFHQPTAFLDAICIPVGVPGIFSSQKTFQSEAAWEDQIFQGLAKKLSQPWFKRPFSNWWEHHQGMAGNFAGVSFPIEDGSKMPAIASMCYFTTQKKSSCYAPDLWWWPKSQSCPRDVRLSKLGGNATLSKGPWLTQAIFFIRCGGPFPFQFLQQTNRSYSRPKKMWVINWHPFEKIKNMFNLTGNFYQASIEAIPEVQFHQLIWKSHSSGKVRCCKSQQNRVTHPHTENKTRTRLHKFSEKHHECLLDLLDLPRFVLPMHPETVYYRTLLFRSFFHQASIQFLVEVTTKT